MPQPKLAGNFLGNKQSQINVDHITNLMQNYLSSTISLLNRHFKKTTEKTKQEVENIGRKTLTNKVCAKLLYGLKIKMYFNELL